MSAPPALNSGTRFCSPPALTRPHPPSILRSCCPDSQEAQETNSWERLRVLAFPPLSSSSLPKTNPVAAPRRLRRQMCCNQHTVDDTGGADLLFVRLARQTPVAAKATRNVVTLAVCVLFYFIFYFFKFSVLLTSGSNILPKVGRIH